MSGTEQPIRGSDAQAVIDAVERLGKPVPIIVGDGQTLEKLALPRGMQLIDIQAELDKRADAPRRAIGEVRANTLDAFIDLTNRHASPDSVVYVDDGLQPRLVAVLNDHGGGAEPGWRDHRVVYSPALSEEWKAWTKLDGQSLSQVDFAAHLEDRCLDVISPQSVGPKTKGVIEQLGVKAASPAELQGLARGLSIKVDQHVKEVRRLDSGEAQVVYSEQHTGEDGKPLAVPNAFVIAIPVFVGGVAYTQVVRLRYKAASGRIAWSYSIVHADRARRDAVLEMMGTIGEKLPDVLVVEGSP